jgi:DNA topoisomerase IA
MKSKNFKPEEYWSITALLTKKTKEEFEAILTKKRRQSHLQDGH